MSVLALVISLATLVYVGIQGLTFSRYLKQLMHELEKLQK